MLSRVRPRARSVSLQSVADNGISSMTDLVLFKCTIHYSRPPRVRPTRPP